MQKNPLLTNTGPNPAQNISINISYNLNTTNKLPKQIIQTKKSTQKTKKISPSTGLQGIGNQFFSQLAFNSLETKNKPRKENQYKKSNQSSLQGKQVTNKVVQKVTAKKKKTQPSSSTTNKQLQASKKQLITQPSQIIPQYYNPLASNAKHFLKRNIQSADIFKADIGKKIKTEGSMCEDSLTAGKRKRAISAKQQYGSVNPKTFKNPKINNFLKQTINNGTMMGNKLAVGSFKTMPKKNLTSNKTPKSKQRNSLSSKPKRIHTQQSQPFVSQTASNPQYRHNKSCMLYSTKKPLPYQNIITEPHLIETASNIMSQYMSVNSTKARKRAQSAYIFGRKDKQLVSKLLNMSMISSQLGSSQLITSQRMRSGRGDMARKQLGLKVDQLDSYSKVRNVQQGNLQSKKQKADKRQEQTVFPGNALRQYLNSIDLRIIKNIQSDTANIVTKSTDQTEKKQRSNFQVNFGKKPASQFTKNFNKEQENEQQFTFSSKIPAKKISKQQESFSKQENSDVVTFYSKLFTNALQNKLLEQKQRYVESANGSQYGDLHQQIKKQRFIVKVFNDEDDQELIEGSQKQQQQGQSNLLQNQDEQGIQIQHENKHQCQQEQSQNSDNELYEFVNQKPVTKNQNKPSQSMKLNFQHYKQILQSHKQQYNATKVMEETQKFDFQLVSCQQENSIKTQEIEKNLMQESQSDGLESPLKYFKEESVQMWNQSKRQNDTNKQVFEQETKKQFKIQVTSSSSAVDPAISIKSPKHSNRQKLSQMRQPEYTEICWQYDEQEFQKQLNSQNRQQGVKRNENFLQIDRGLTSSPTNNSDIGSGDEEYDSKKYSVGQQNDGKDKINEQFSGSKTAQKFGQSQDRWAIVAQNPTNSLIDHQIDSLNDQQSLSCQDRQIGTAQRWVNPAFCQLKQSPQNSNEKQLQEQKNDDYLQCSLANFGVVNKNQQIKRPFESKNNQIHQKDQVEDKKIPTIQLQINEILNPNNQQNQQQPKQQNEQKPDPFAQIRKKRLSHIVEDIILQLIRQFAKDISYILKKSSTQKRTNIQFEENSSPLRVNKSDQFLQQNELSPFSRDQQMFGLMGQQLLSDNNRIQNNNYVNNQRQANNNIKKSQFVGKCFGIDTSFISVQRYLKQFKQYVMKDEKLKQSIIKNINKDIGPNSLEILSYLRPQYDGMMMDGQQGQNEYGQMMDGSTRTMDATQQLQQQDQQQQQDGLFVVPSQAFSQFQNHLQQQLQQRNKSLQPEKQIILTQKQKRNTNFWHRGIYQSWNQFLDYERPYGINGKPYEWIKERKKYREVKMQNVQEKLQRGIDKLLQAISLPSGIIYDKFQMSPIYMDLSQQQKMYLNEERLSRMLAIQLFESEQTWINYNDEMAQLLVQLSRIIEERIFFQVATQVKRVQRRRRFQGMGIMDKIDESRQGNDENNNRLGKISEQQDDLYQRDEQRYLVN